jgi:uncharacterized protein (TIGR02300 family)
MTTARKKPTKRPAKPTARKAVSPKPSAAAARKKPAKPAARREPAPAAPAPAAPAPRPASPTPRPASPTPRPASPAPRARSGSAKAAAKQPTGGDVRGRLGAKWVCFKCSAKFYDLNRPEPLCPKCGANQNERPKREPKGKQPVVEAPPPRPVAPDRELIPEEDEDDALLMEDEEIDLGTPELDGEGAEDFGEEEEEEPSDV